MKEEQKKQLPKGIIRKSAARLAAVQALYSWEIGGTQKDPKLLALDLIAFYTPTEDAHDDRDEVALVKNGVLPDARFLSMLVGGVLENQKRLDEIIAEHLAENWSLERLGAVLRALLRSAIFELLECKDVPPKVVINEYIEVARAFFGNDEVRFTNGILDNVAKKVRS